MTTEQPSQRGAHPQHRVLFFSPHAGIWQHAFPEALVADSIRIAGAELIYVTCDGAFRTFCVTMSAQGLRADSPADRKERVCRGCRRNRDLLRNDFGFGGCDLDSVLGPADQARIETLLDEAKREGLVSFIVDGVPVGRLSLYEYLILYKKLVTALDETEWLAFRPILANVLRSLIAAQRILDREAPTRLVLYNSLYSVNAVWRAAATARGIPVYVTHGGPNFARRLQTLLVARDSTTAYAYRVVAAWPRYQNQPCNPQELAVITDHFCELLAGTNVFAYSAPKSHERGDWRTRFGIRPDQKLLVATMSSYDEYVAACTVGEMPDESGLLFPKQIDWIRSLVEWVRDRPELFLVLRVHPREFPNKREGVKSEHARLLEAELTTLPPNARVNWPTDRLSLYDIAEYADVFLNAWSSAGREMTLLGRPVVVYCPSLLTYPPALNYVGTTRDAYFSAIDEALRSGWSFERIRTAFRACVVEFVHSIADVGDGFDYSEKRATSVMQRARNLAYLVPGVRQRRDLWRRPRILDAQERIAQVVLSGAGTLLDLPAPQRVPVTLAEETAALKYELTRLAKSLYAGASGPPVRGTLRAHLASLSAPT